MPVEPTIVQAVLSFMFSVVFVAVLLVLAFSVFKDKWRTRGGHTQNEYALKPRQNNYEVKFITGGNYRR